MCTIDEFKKLCSDYNLYYYDASGLGYGFFIKSDKITFLNQSVIMFFGSKLNGKLKIYHGEVDDKGRVPTYSTTFIIVSEVSTAKYYLNILVQKRKEILINKRLKEIDNDFS
jgi:hypothetical protein